LIEFGQPAMTSISHSRMFDTALPGRLLRLEIDIS
jgi:hypothetical protein